MSEETEYLELEHNLNSMEETLRIKREAIHRSAQKLVNAMWLVPKQHTTPTQSLALVKEALFDLLEAIQ